MSYGDKILQWIISGGGGAKAPNEYCPGDMLSGRPTLGPTFLDLMDRKSALDYPLLAGTYVLNLFTLVTFWGSF